LINNFSSVLRNRLSIVEKFDFYIFNIYLLTGCLQATVDLDDLDTKRRKEFKNYEMEKEHLRRKELDDMDESKRAEAEKKYEDLKKKHADHPKLHHPVCLCCDS